MQPDAHDLGQQDVRIIGSDKFIEEVHSRAHRIQLVAQGDGVEIWRQHIASGGRFSLLPDEGWEGLEFFQVLQGALAYLVGGEQRVLGPGDSVAAVRIRQPAMFTALEETVILYVCSRPTFHQVSKEIQVLMDLANAVEEKDGYTAGHCDRIRDLSVRVGELLRLSPVRLHYLSLGAYLHDLGKVRVPAAILGKPGSLTEAEWDVMRQHPTFGRQMVEGTLLQDAGPIIEQHHERLDGSGYPQGLKNGAILLEAQIVAVVDTFDAITTDRPYRKGLPPDHAVAELRRYRGVHYDADVVEAFVSVAERSPKAR